MDYEPDIPDDINADPLHCTVVLNEEINELHVELNKILTEFLNRTGLKIRGATTHIYKEETGEETFKGIEIQFGL